ncbi:MAG: hypothetical protein QGG40_04890, partial [Myxococcota bacterium]|nr:hypothetical protein [Myxococcota bacterium]
MKHGLGWLLAVAATLALVVGLEVTRLQAPLPQVRLLEGLGLGWMPPGTRVGLSGNLYGVGTWVGASWILLGCTAVGRWSRGVTLLGCAVVLVVALLPQAHVGHELYPVDARERGLHDRAEVPVVIDGTLQRRDWERTVLNPAVPLLLVRRMWVTERHLAAIAQGMVAEAVTQGGEAPPATQGLAWSVVHLGTGLAWCLRGALPLVCLVLGLTRVWTRVPGRWAGISGRWCGLGVMIVPPFFTLVALGIHTLGGGGGAP